MQTLNIGLFIWPSQTLKKTTKKTKQKESQAPNIHNPTIHFPSNGPISILLPTTTQSLPRILIMNDEYLFRVASLVCKVMGSSVFIPLSFIISNKKNSPNSARTSGNWNPFICSSFHPNQPQKSSLIIPHSRQLVRDIACVSGWVPNVQVHLHSNS